MGCSYCNGTDTCSGRGSMRESCLDEDLLGEGLEESLMEARS